MDLGNEALTKTTSIYTESDIKLKDVITYRSNKKGMVILYEGNNGQDKETSEIQQVILTKHADSQVA